MNDATTLAAETSPPAIIVVQYGPFWSASVHNDAGKWEYGNTKAEVIGKLHISHPALFGTVIVEGERQAQYE